MLGALKNLFSGKSDTPANTYWQGTIGLTLMVYKNELETHVQSGIRRYDYFFKLADDVRKSSPSADIEKRYLKRSLIWNLMFCCPRKPRVSGCLSFGARQVVRRRRRNSLRITWWARIWPDMILMA